LYIFLQNYISGEPDIFLDVSHICSRTFVSNKEIVKSFGYASKEYGYSKPLQHARRYMDFRPKLSLYPHPAQIIGPLL
jgi:hypothetical protein